MFKNYFTTAWRNTIKHKAYAAFNITGLAIGLAVFIVTLLYVNTETGYDKWDAQLARVYRTGITKTSDGETTSMFWTAYPLGTQLVNTCPEAEAVTRINETGEQLITIGENSIYEKKIIAADSFFFKVFPYRFIEGSRQAALNAPNTAVISTAMAKKLFGNSTAVGKTIDVSAAYSGKKTYRVTGVIEKIGPSHLDFNICLYHIDRDPSYWGRQLYTTYVLLKPGASVPVMAAKAKQIYLNGEASYLYKQLSAENKTLAAPGAQAAEWLKTNSKLTGADVFFEPVANIHLNPVASGWRDAAANHPVLDTEKGNDKPVLYFSMAAILVLLLACINYTNLSVARAGRRAKETGMRKVMGAAKRQLVIQFLLEAFMQCLVALFLALLLSVWLTGFVNHAFHLQLRLFNILSPRNNLYFLGQLVAIVIVVTLLSGAYPAFILSSFKPVKVLTGNIAKTIKGAFARNGLVVLQFVISTAFVCCLVVIYAQLKYMQTNDAGFSTQQVLVLSPANTNIITPGQKDEKLAYIQNRLLQIPGVKQVAFADAYPGAPSVDVQQATYNGSTFDLAFHYVHYDYCKLLGMPLAAGRDFSAAYVTDSVNTAILNETAVRRLALKKPLGATINIMLRDYTIIGVIKDNYEAGYNTQVAPAIYAIGAKPGLLNYSSVLIKLSGNQAQAAVSSIQSLWKTVEPGFPIKYAWLDEEFGKLIEKYQRFGAITAMLAVISLVIALMGIFAIAAFTAAQRTKEIGIRKVFGGSVAGITLMLLKKFTVLVITALGAAFPLAYWFMHTWLQGFAYRAPINGPMFVLSGFAVAAIALTTVGLQAVKAAMASPIKSLRV